jgi:hypothetical protein
LDVSIGWSIGRLIDGGRGYRFRLSTLFYCSRGVIVRESIDNFCCGCLPLVGAQLWAIGGVWRCGVACSGGRLGCVWRSGVACSGGIARKLASTGAALMTLGCRWFAVRRSPLVGDWWSGVAVLPVLVGSPTSGLLQERLLMTLGCRRFAVRRSPLVGNWGCLALRCCLFWRDRPQVDSYRSGFDVLGCRWFAVRRSPLVGDWGVSGVAVLPVGAIAHKWAPTGAALMTLGCGRFAVRRSPLVGDWWVSGAAVLPVLAGSPTSGLLQGRNLMPLGYTPFI